MPTTVAPTSGLIARVALGGLIGSAVRVAAGAAIPDSTFPWDTVAVNLFGAFVIALLLPRLRGHRDRLALVVFGIGGAATTFSALVLDAATLADAGRIGAVAGYLALTVIGGFTVAAVGLHLGGRR